MKKALSFFLLIALTLLGALPARALETKQVGTPSTTTTGNLPFYSMSKYGQGINIYKKEAIGLDAGKVIKSLTFLGTMGADADGNTIRSLSELEVYIGNTTSTDFNSFIVDGEPENNTPTTVVNTENMTKFFALTQGQTFDFESGGTKENPIEIFSVVSEEGFEYTGDNIVLYISAGGKAINCYFTVCATTSGINYRALGAHRESSHIISGYSIYTKKWSSDVDTKSYAPVMIIGYEGDKQVVTAEVSGKIYGSKSNASGLAGATVEFDGKTTTTDNFGNYKFTVDDVDANATYIIKASAEGHEPAERTIDIKSGGSFTGIDLRLEKIAVPATLSGKVLVKGTTETIAGATLTFNGQTLVSGTDGAYSFDVANIDDIDTNGLPLTASMKGYNPFSTNIRLTGDLTYNVEMEALPELPGTGVLVGQYGLTEYEYVLPFNTLENYSASEMLYPAAALSEMAAGTKIGSLSFYGYISVPSTGGGDEEEEGNGDLTYDSFYAPVKKAAEGEAEVIYKGSIKIYMFNSEADAFPRTGATATDLSEMPPVYEGNVAFTYEGANNAPVQLINAQFDVPFEYTGKSLTICVVSNSKSMKIVNFAYDATYTLNALACKGNSAEAAGAYSLYTKGLPVVRFGQFVPVGTVAGVVTDAVTEAAVEGASVTLGTGEDAVTATTDADGAYSLKMRGIEYGQDYRLAISAGKYNDYVEEVSFTEAAPEVTKDVALTFGVVISGVVTNGKTQQPMADVEVVLGEGEDAQKFTSDAEGAFVFEVDPVTELSMALTASAPGFNDFSTTIDLSKVEGNEVTDVAVVMDAEDVTIPSTATDLSAKGTANCYIVAPGSTAFFDVTYKGNSTTEKVGEISDAMLVWQDSKGLIESLDYVPEENVVLIKVANRPGNAVVSVIDTYVNVLWSWHIWVTDYDSDNDFTTEPNDAGTTWTFMDRNLGATSMEKGSFANYGMLYQWGRKDPFPGAAAFTVQNDDFSYEEDGEPTLYNMAGDELPTILDLVQVEGTWAQSIKNPMSFYKLYQINTGEKDEYGQEIKEDVYPTRDWTDDSNDDAWGGVSFKKSIYDPSPVGYKVPVCDEAGNTPYAWLEYAKMTWNTEARGAEQDGQWFPATGTRVNFSGGLDCSENGNPYSGLWIGTKGKESADLEANPQLYAQYMFIINGKRTFKVNKDSRAQGMSLRCVREENPSSGVENVAVDGVEVDGAVYTIAGVKVLDAATPEAVRTLAPGIYVAKGKKFMVK